jgi:GWxTD domain-containing protein
MSVRPHALVLAAALAAAPAALAQKMDKDAKKWLDDVQPIMVPEEEKFFKDLKDKGEREEFQKIFWARRDPDGDPKTPNEFQTEYLKAKAEADSRYRVSGSPGSLTDCGRVYILLGAPDEVKAGERGASPGRTPENWTYRERPGLKVQGGQLTLAFDEMCLFPMGARFGDQLDRLAETKIVLPNLGYKRGPDGKLVKLADQLPKPTPAMALVETPRQDFASVLQPKMTVKSAGGAYLAGLLRAEVSGLATQDAAGKKLVPLTVAVQALDEAGRTVGAAEKEVLAEIGADGMALVSYGMALKPGKYSVRVGVIQSKDGKGSAVALDQVVPDFATDELIMGDILVLRAVEEGTTALPQDPLWAFQFGPMRFVPTYDNVLTKADAPTLIMPIYNPARDEAGKPSTATEFTVLKDGKPLARSEEQIYDSESPTPSVGPLPLANYQPGTYTVQVKTRDMVTKKDYTKEATFQVK